MQRTKIQYLTHTWNPIKMRCTPVSSGCANCWHLAMAKRLENNLMISAPHRAAYRGEGPELDQKELEAPLHLKKPARIGVQFMGDLWHGSVEHFTIAKIWSLARKCQRHTFFFLTKRPERLRDWTFVKSEVAHVPKIVGEIWPDNCWLGVSISTNDDLWMVETLLQIPAAHYWISHEPGLGKVTYPKEFLSLGKDCFLVTGGETGPRARPMHPDIPRHDRDQCQSAGVPFFFKSWGDGLILPKEKKRLIDGREWNEMP